MISTCCAGVGLLSLLGLFLSVMLIQQKVHPVYVASSLPGVQLSFGVDHLSAFFLIILFGISFVTSIYAVGNLRIQKLLESSVPFLPVLISSIALIFISCDGFSFLFSWELMSVASFFLVAAEHEFPKAREAAWIYLIATHIASALIFIYFAVMYDSVGSLLFSQFVPLSGALASFLFISIFIGFGTKAGVWPFHVWMPHAYNASPSYFVAFMSGVMINVGLYGLLRFFLIIGTVEIWWGILLLSLGVISAVMGVLNAIVQPNLKKLLAYSSVENVGIILMGLGLAMLGMALKNNALVMFGFAGALFHLLSHSVLKSLLFFGAGSIFHITKTQKIDSLGGLLKKAPVTGISFLAGSLAICGLPPFSGFIGELIIFVGLFIAIQTLSGAALLSVLFATIGLAFAGALAVVCFTKAFGVIFLGFPRCEDNASWCESSNLICAPMIAMTVLSLLIALLPAPFFKVVSFVVQQIAPAAVMLHSSQILEIISQVSAGFAALLIAVLILAAFYFRAFKDKKVAKTVTWDCGFEAPVPRIQYTGSSFVEPVAVFFKMLIGWKEEIATSGEKVLKDVSCSEKCADVAEHSFFEPVFKLFERFVAFVRRYQRRTIQSYLTLMFIALLILLIWEVWIGF